MWGCATAVATVLGDAFTFPRRLHMHPHMMPLPRRAHWRSIRRSDPQVITNDSFVSRKAVKREVVMCKKQLVGNRLACGITPAPGPKLPQLPALRPVSMAMGPMLAEPEAVLMFADHEVVNCQVMITARLTRLRHLWTSTGLQRGLSAWPSSRLEGSRLASQRAGVFSASVRGSTHRGSRIAAMSTAAPPVLADGAPQTQELDALRQQLADLQVTRATCLSSLSG